MRPINEETTYFEDLGGGDQGRLSCRACKGSLIIVEERLRSIYMTEDVLYAGEDWGDEDDEWKIVCDCTGVRWQRPEHDLFDPDIPD